MNGDMMYGKCECCGKEKPLQRTYFRYPIDCQCHNDQHFELFDHCADCIPQKPEETKVWLSVRQIKEIDALREENAKLSAQVVGLHKALKKADLFITNGIEFGYIRMPDANSGDVALETPNIIKQALSQLDPGAEILDRIAMLEAVAEASERLYKQIVANSHTHSLDMSGYHGETIRIQQGEKGKEYWQAMWAYNDALAALGDAHE